MRKTHEKVEEHIYVSKSDCCRANIRRAYIIIDPLNRFYEGIAFVYS